MHSHWTGIFDRKCLSGHKRFSRKQNQIIEKILH